MFDQFDAPAAPEQPISTGLDVVESAASGLPRGLIETIMSPVTLARMAESGLGYVGEKGADLGATMGMTPLTDEQRKAIREPSSLTKPFYDSQDKVRDYMNDKLHKPQTTPGKFAGTVAEFATPGGLPSRAARTAPGLAKVGRYAEEALGNVIFPALSSEGAGQAAEGTQYEGMMRFLGALFGNAGAAAGRAHNAPEAVIRRATEGTTDAEWQAARRLQDNNFGIDLSSPESLAQARGGASKLRDILRVVEGSTTGGNITAPFFAARPAQVDSAVGGVLDQIAPQSANPSVLGPRAAEAGTKAVREVEQARTAAVDPVYAAANTDQVPADQVQALLAQIDSAAAADKTGVLSGPLKELRGRLIATPAKAGVPSVRTPVTGPDGQVTRYTQTPAVDPVPEVPITDIENLDRTRKYFRDRMNLPQIGQDAITKEQNAAITNILTQLDSSMEGASQNFAAGKQRYADISKNVVQPIAEGPVGRVAAAQDTATAGNAILPQNPLAGSAGEAADATARLAAQDPETAAALVRQNLADRYSAAQTETQGGSREGAGAKFHKSVAGNDQRREVLDAVLRALPGGQVAAQAVPQLLEVLQATMRRDAPGSSTAANQLIHGDLGARSPIGAVIDLTKSLGASFLTQAGDAAKRAQLRGNLAHLGDILTGPEAVQRTRAARDRRPTVSYPEAGLRTLFESGQTLQDPRGAR
ncbi:hypothetical protein LB559_16155 [Mesorhizobium sp. BR1-1-3]|uniref:hypothetical protein n=1 Tax=Mesorhizobium sp. BR1-1-3 TaxID=2876651 RepID=UPI001CD06758|nr:hypothetical protein [Mesorhizobium sp. BR1-1-3]MBZ9889460.1 hypothetical protein [Mesorhizobium sp. BR1-1-3]